MDVTPDQSAHGRRILLIQSLVGVVVVAGFFIAQGASAAGAAAYGVGVGMVVAVLLARSVRRAQALAATSVQSARHGVVLLYLGAVQRFLVVLILFGVGLGLWKLSPLAVIVGFFCAQLAYLLGKRTPNI